MSKPLQGGCLCGDTRYRLHAHGDDVPLCHCINCRRASGAPVLAWVSVPRESLEWTGHAPASYDYASDLAPHVRRNFCPRCGSQLTWEHIGDHDLYVALGTLDEAEALLPTRHVFASRQLSWLRLDDDLPRDDR